MTRTDDPANREFSPGELWLFVGTIAIAGLATILILTVRP